MIAIAVLFLVVVVALGRLTIAALALVLGLLGLLARSLLALTRPRMVR